MRHARELNPDAFEELRFRRLLQASLKLARLPSR